MVIKSLNLKVDSSNPPIGALLVANHVKQNLAINVEWGNETNLCLPDGFILDTSASISRYLARVSQGCTLYGNSLLTRTEVDHWLTFSLPPFGGKNGYNAAIKDLNDSLSMNTYLVGHDITIADLCVFGELYYHPEWEKSSSTVPNVLRWFELIKSKPLVGEVLKTAPTTITINTRNEPQERKQEGKFVDLPGAEMGKVIVRFPPEASGYLHIGHAKAALLNQYYQEAFQGKLIMRFDDTNPAKEKIDFEKVILQDLELLHIKPDEFTHTSSYFDLMLDLCEKMLKEEKAYVDDTDPELMKQEREQRIESKNRSNTVEKNFKMWQEMVKGTANGQKCCVRAKIDMQSPNGCMRDPTIYRCKNEPHPRTGTKYKVYPTYDFACPIVDSIENVTHALRTLEYHDRDDQYYWFIDALKIRKPYIWEYSRLNMTNTVLSKRKLTWFVDNGYVDGWDDPRFPTVRGILRRGMTVEALKQFIIAQGSSRAVNLMEWDKIWSINKKVIDPIAPRYTALEEEGTVPVLIKGVKEELAQVAKHPKNNDIGMKNVWIGPRILIDGSDAETLKEGENTTFINWGNLMIKKINRKDGKVISVEAEANLENKDFKKTLKLTWLADTGKAPMIPCACVYFDHIISKGNLGKDEDFKQYIDHVTRIDAMMMGDPELVNVKKGEIIQLQRRGFFICDSPYQPVSIHSGKESPIVLFCIPDGHAKMMPTAGPPKKPQEMSTKEKLQSAKGKVAEKSPQDEQGPLFDAIKLDQAIREQGELIRKLKQEKADKQTLTPHINTLLKLKEEFKSKTGSDWKPDVKISPPAAPTPVIPATSATSAADIDNKIKEQGDKVRQLKADKVTKDQIQAAVKILLELKEQYKKTTGSDWTPTAAVNTNPQPANNANDIKEINEKIVEQGNKVRQLKSEKASKEVVTAEVKKLLDLKNQFKNITSLDWTPEVGNKFIESSNNKSDSMASDEPALIEEITKQGDKVRDLKSKSAPKDEIDAAVKILLSLKDKYKEITGKAFQPANAPVRSGNKKEKAVQPQQPKKAPAKPGTEAVADESGGKKQTRLGLEAKKEENLSDWYSQVITKGEMIEYYDVSGCYILRPWSYSIWEAIQTWFDGEIKKLGVQNSYFPIFVSKHALEKEKTHIADFAPEVAWVTKSGDTDLAEHIAVRPTSETVMYPAYAKWVQSYRDLPIKLNQWNNVVRWEFKHPQPFLRTREFLWQEGHTAHAEAKDAVDEVYQILDLYASVYQNLLAIPVVKGRKTEKEKFAGGDFTTTVEAFVSASGRGIQGATSHHLGQNFSKMFEIVFEHPETQEKQFVFQNSWGITTRTIGVMIMIHADNQGLVLPPKVACIQVVLVPCGITANMKDEDKKALLNSCDELEKSLVSDGVKVKGDYRDNYSPGWKFNHWELKGVPIRIELGPKDMKQGQIIAVRRDTGEKITIPRSTAVKDIKKLLDDIQANMFAKASNEMKNHTKICKNWKDFCQQLDGKNIILAPFCGEISCEDKIKKDSAKDDVEAEAGAAAMGAKGLCIPFDQPMEIKSNDKCIYQDCNNKPKFYTLFGRSY